MKIRIEQPAGEHERFAADPFKSNVGKTVPVESIPGVYVDGVVTATGGGGESAWFEVEVPDAAAPLFKDRSIVPGSIGFVE